MQRVLMRDVAVERTRRVEHVRAHPARGFDAVMRAIAEGDGDGGTR